MEGLEATEISVRWLNDEKRVDAQYFRKAYLEEDARRKKHDNLPIGSQAVVTDGPHGYHEVDEESPVAMLTAKCAKGWFASREGADSISLRTHNANLRSSLQPSDLILSTRGTVGLCAIVEADIIPANIDQDVARISMRTPSEFDSRYLLAYLNSRFGQDWMTRNATGMVQQGLSLSSVRELPVPKLTPEFQKRIGVAISLASETRKSAEALVESADKMLLAELGLADWTPPEPLTYPISVRNVFAAGRFDAQYFSPRVQELIQRLSGSNLTIGDVAPLRKHQFQPEPGKLFEYIEIGDISQHGEATNTKLDGGEAPSRATWHVHEGDVITSTVRPIRRLSAQIQFEQNLFVCSSGFAVLHPKRVPSELLLVYLRLPVICELMDLHTTASMYPAIAVTDLLALPFAMPSSASVPSIVQKVKESRVARRRAQDLLEAAKRAVEIAIEESEAAALEYLEGI